MNVHYWDGLSRPVPPCLQHVLTIGNFDGVHRGHQALFQRLVALKHQLHRPALAVTFDPSPLAVLRPDLVIEPLTTMPQRLELLGRLHLDNVLVLCSNPRLLELSAHEFWHHLLIEQLQIQGIVEGANFHFGKHRQGRVQELQRWSAEAGIPCTIVEDVFLEEGPPPGIHISSSLIRQCLQAGDILQANRALGRAYSLTGYIVEGEKRGRTLGFPTANLADIPTLLPREGVYAGRTRILDQNYAVALHIGPNPTFGVQQRKIEAHLLDYSGQLYGSTLTLELEQRVRDIRKFDSVDDLRAQLANDLAEVRRLIPPTSSLLTSTSRTTPSMTTPGTTSTLQERVAQAFTTALQPEMQAAGLELLLGGVDADGVVTVHLEGACQSCPSTAMALIMGIERRLIELVPEVAYLEVTPKR